MSRGIRKNRVIAGFSEIIHCFNNGYSRRIQVKILLHLIVIPPLLSGDCPM